MGTSASAVSPVPRHRKQFGWVDAHGADADTGLLYMRQRWYDPTLQRFISRDPIGLRGGANLYGYCLGRPHSAVDPMGLSFRVLGPADLANQLLYQLEQFSGLQLSFDSNRQLRIDGGIGSSAAAQFIRKLVCSKHVTTVRVVDRTPAGGPGSYFTGPDTFQHLSPGDLNHLRWLDVGVAAGALFHELGEAYSRSLHGDQANFHQIPDAGGIVADVDSRERYHRDHFGTAMDWQRQVLADYGLVNYGNSWVFSRGTDVFEVSKDYTKRWPSGVYGKARKNLIWLREFLKIMEDCKKCP